MPRPATLPELVHVIRRSRLVDESRLDRYAGDASHPDSLPVSTEQFLARLVGDGLLTPFQAERLGAGQWKGFIRGEYRVLDRLGSGGMSQVFLAEPTGGGLVALKVLHEGMAFDPVVRARFLREVRAAAALTHPNVVRVYGASADTDPPFLVMEYIDGVSLQAAVARTGTFDAGTAAHCARQVALGLQRAHEVGLVHRDIKPANVLVGRDGVVKILDLGIVRMDPAEGLTLCATERQVLGTADYLAPEQALDSHAVDTRADVYALGSTLYFLLAGHPPFPDGSPSAVIRRKQAFDPVPIERLRPDLSPGLAGVVQTMLARRPQNRFTTPQAAADALAPFAAPDGGFPARLFAPDRHTVADLTGRPTASLPAPPPAAADGPATAVVPSEPAADPDDLIDLDPPFRRV